MLLMSLMFCVCISDSCGGFLYSYSIRCVAQVQIPIVSIRSSWLPTLYASMESGVQFHDYGHTPWNTLNTMDIMVLGPIVTEFLCVRPSALSVCNPCPGHFLDRWRRKSTMFPKKEPDYCRCNGDGLCALSLDIMPKLSLRCTCIGKVAKALPQHTHGESEYCAMSEHNVILNRM